MKPRKLLAVAAGNNKFLSTNVKGESLLYDGTAFVLFGFFFEQMNGSIYHNSLDFFIISFSCKKNTCRIYFWVFIH